MKKSIVLLAAFLLTTLVASAQMFTTSPAILQESSKNVEITFHADRSGVDALTNLASSKPLYAHIGVYTTKSPSSWSHVVSNWSTDSPDYQFQYVSTNTYKLTLGDLRTYFKITDENEHITKVCIIARTAGGTAQTSDQFLTVYEDGFMAALTADYDDAVITQPTTINFTGYATEAANMTITVNGSSVASVTGKTSISASYNFNTPAEYKVVLTATKNGETRTQELTYLYPNASPSGTYPGGVPKMGAVRNADGTVTFCIAAPGKASCVIVPSWDGYQTLEKNLMKYQDYNGNRYFWITVDGLDETTAYPYYYLVDYTHKVGDPYAHLVLDPWNDRYLSSKVFPDRPKYPTEVKDKVMLAVYQENIDDYDWKVKNFTIPSHESLNVYELLLRDFTGTNSKDDGTVREAISKIPYLKALGINVVELMPIMEFNGNNSWGYNTNFYMAPDKAYGSPKDYKDFIDECHRQGIAVVLDIVFNQSDGLHPWYQLYPIDSNPFYNKYAPHEFSVLNDWKQENTLVQKQWEDAITYWMTKYNVDGFRFDLVKGLGTSYSGGTGDYNASRVEVMKRLHSHIRACKPNGIHINEHLAGAKEENEMGADGQINWANKNNNSCQYAMGYASSSDLRSFYAARDGRTIGTTVSYAESHDEERMGYKQNQWGVAGVKGDVATSMLRLGSVAAQMLMTPGARMIWQFGELGADQTTKTSDGGNNTSPKKVVWDFLNDPDRKALHDNYAELLNLRIENPTLFGNSAECVHNGFANSLGARSIRLNSGSKELVVLLNPATAGTASVECEVSRLSAANSRVVSASKGFTPSYSFSGGKVSAQVPAHSYCVIATNSVAALDAPMADVAAAAALGYVDGRRINIAGDYTSAALYNVSGMRQSLDAELAPGLYILSVDGQSQKLIVR